MLQWMVILADGSAQNPQQSKQDAQTEVLYAGVILLAVIIIGGALVMRYRAKVTSKEKSQEELGFGLTDLKKLRDRGDLTIQEYEAAREKIAAKTKNKAGVASGELTLPRLREMLDSGELTAAQYEMERKKIVERLNGRS